MPNVADRRAGVQRNVNLVIDNCGVGESILLLIQREVGGWDGVTVSPHRYGGIEFRVGRRELGHLHGSRLADLPFPVAVRKQLVESGKAEPHHILPQSGWVSVRLRSEADAKNVIDLFRLNYDRPWRAPASSPAPVDPHTI